MGVVWRQRGVRVVGGNRFCNWLRILVRVIWRRNGVRVVGEKTFCNWLRILVRVIWRRNGVRVVGEKTFCNWLRILVSLKSEVSVGGVNGRIGAERGGCLANAKRAFEDTGHADAYTSLLNGWGRGGWVLFNGLLHGCSVGGRLQRGCGPVSGRGIAHPA
jgi:hypothetical protein